MHAPVHTIQVKIVLFWFVGAMIPVWLSYPLIGAVTRFITRKLRASRNHTARSIAPYGPLIVYFILWCAFYFPVRNRRAGVRIRARVRVRLWVPLPGACTTQ